MLYNYKVKETDMSKRFADFDKHTADALQRYPTDLYVLTIDM
jgi:hypothetical protein